jgi:hypothetical protein
MCYPNLKPHTSALSAMILVLLTAITCLCNQLGFLPPFPIEPPHPTKKFWNNSTGPHVVTTGKNKNVSSGGEFSITFGKSIERCTTSDVVVSASTSNSATSNCSERRCSCILFGEEGYFLHESEKKYCPTLGVRIALHVDSENPERRAIEDYQDPSDSRERQVHYIQ